MHRDPKIPVIVKDIDEIIRYLEGHHFNRDYLNMLHNLKVELVILYNGKEINGKK